MTYLRNSLLLLIGLFISLQVLAQDVVSNDVKYKDRTLASHTISIDGERDIVEDYWEDFLKDRYDIKLKRDGRDGSSVFYTAEQATASSLTSKAFDLMSKVTETNQGNATVSAGMAFGYDVSASESNYQTEYARLKDMMSSFSTYFYDRYYGKLESDLQTKIDDIQKDHDKLEKATKKDRKKIEKWEKKCAKLQEKTEETRTEIQSQLDEMEKHKSDLVEMKTKMVELQSMRAPYKKN